MANNAQANQTEAEAILENFKNNLENTSKNE